MLWNVYRSFGLILIALGPAVQGQTISFFRDFSTPQMNRASAMAVDATGVYVFGTRPATVAGGQSAAGVRKYDGAGNELWTRDFNPPASGNITFLSAAAEPTGVYVLAGLGDFARLFVRKYSTQGTELWTRDMGFSAPGAFAVDATGVYVVGRDFPPNFSYLRKYSTGGTELYTTKFGNSQELQNPHALAVDSTGIYLFGIGAPAGGPRTGSFLRKYNLGGNELWTRDFSFPFSLSPSALVRAETTGFYILAGQVTALRKYDSDGTEVWARQLASGAGAVAVVADGAAVYVAGSTSVGLPGQCRSGAIDFFATKYDTAGIEQWTREFGPSDGALANGIAVDSSGVYVAGQAGLSGFSDFDVLPPAENANRVFLARLEKASAPVTLTTLRIFPGCVVNAASYVGGGVAPGEIVTIFGSGIGPSPLASVQLNQNRTIATTLAATRILFNGMPAPLLSVSDKQSSAIVPYAVAGRSYPSWRYPDATGAPAPLPLGTAHPDTRPERPPRRGPR